MENPITAIEYTITDNGFYEGCEGISEDDQIQSLNNYVDEVRRMLAKTYAPATVTVDIAPGTGYNKLAVRHAREDEWDGGNDEADIDAQIATVWDRGMFWSDAS